MNYGLPKAHQLPFFELDRTVTPSPVNPLGVKGVGEAGAIASPPAVVNAVMDALRPFGIAHLDMPLTAPKVWQAIQAARAANAGVTRSDPREVSAPCIRHRSSTIARRAWTRRSRSSHSIGDDGKLIAGGHSLLPVMKLRFAQPAHLIDIRTCPELAGIREENGALRIGATTTHAAVAASDVIRRRVPMLAEAAGQIGDAQVRNMGTIGGSLAHADPAADLPAVMLAFGAELRVVGRRGPRTIPVDEFFTGMFSSALARDELLVEVRVPIPAARTGARTRSTPTRPRDTRSWASRRW